MLKKVVYKLHLWLGLTSGLLMFIIAITGSLYTFQEELAGFGNYQHVTEQQRDFMLPTLLVNRAEKALPGKSLHSIIYKSGNQAVETIFYNNNPAYYFIVYLNPYTGEIQKVKNMEQDFFRFILKGHFYLWLPPQIGQPVVALTTLIFVFVILTGLVIWIPNNLKALKKRIWFRWGKNTKGSRKNFDLHVVGGLYATLFALIFAITGLVWGFQWFARLYYNLAGGKKSLDYTELISDKPKASHQSTSVEPLDRVWYIMQKEYPTAASIEIHPTQTDSSVIEANANEHDGKYWKTDYRYFDQHSLQDIDVNNIYGRFNEVTFADKLFRMNYEIHTGAILGLPGKIFAFLMSLFIASLPVTGVILWLKKRRVTPRLLSGYNR
jgi:uncharacterized iron-regulated membrane protein